jgi:hypothetical protein
MLLWRWFWGFALVELAENVKSPYLTELLSHPFSLRANYSCILAVAYTTFLIQSIYGSTTFVNLGRFSRFLIYTQSLGLLRLGISPSQGRYLRTQESTNTEQTHINIHASSRIRTYDPSVRTGTPNPRPSSP